MTLPSSGSITGTDIRSELRLGSSDQFTVVASSSNIVNWLAGQNGTQVSMPTELYSRAGFKLMDSTALTAGTSQSFSSVNLGPNYTGRTLFFVVEMLGKASATTSGWTITNFTVAGTNLGNKSYSFWQGGAGSTRMVGLAIFSSAAISATSGTISFTSSNTTSFRVHVFSTANPVASTDGGDQEGASLTSVSLGLITAASNGLIISACISQREAGSVTHTHGAGSAWTTLFNDPTGGGYTTTIAFKNRLTSGNYTVNCAFSATTDMAVLVGGAV